MQPEKKSVYLKRAFKSSQWWRVVVWIKKGMSIFPTDMPLSPSLIASELNFLWQLLRRFNWRGPLRHRKCLTLGGRRSRQ